MSKFSTVKSLVWDLDEAITKACERHPATSTGTLDKNFHVRGNDCLPSDIN